MKADEMKNEEVLRIIQEFAQTSNWIPNQTTLYTLVVIYSLMMIVAFLLNIVIFFTVLISKNLHKPNILLSLNLIIANLITTIVCTPFTVNSIIFEFWKFNELLCKFIPFLQATTVFVISTTVTVISIDRYMIITSLKPNHYKLLRPLNNFSKNKLTVNFIIWILAIILSSPVLIYQRLVTVGVKNFYVKKVCIEMYPDSIRIVYTCLTFICCFIIPLLTLSYFHYKIKIYLNANIRKFDLNRDKLMTKLASIKTISNKDQHALFLNLDKRHSDANNYCSLIELNFFNSSDSHSSPTQVRDSSPFNNDSDKAKVSIKINRKKMLNKSLTLSNNFQFSLPIPKLESKNNENFAMSNHQTIYKSNTTNTLSTETMLNIKKHCSSYIFLNQLSVNHLSLNHLEMDGIKSKLHTQKIHSNELPEKEFSISSSQLPNFNSVFTYKLSPKKPKLNDKEFSDLNKSNFVSICRSFSDTNLLEFNQSNSHHSFVHELNQASLNDAVILNKANLQNQSEQISPLFSTKGTNLDYLELVNFDYNQRQNTIINLDNRPDKARKNDQLKLASFTRFSFLNKVKRFHYLNRELQRNQKITFILVLGIIVFGISWLPLNVYNLYMDFNYADTQLPPHDIILIFAVVHLISFSSTITNSLLYGAMNTNIQKELVKLFKNCLHSRG